MKKRGLEEFKSLHDPATIIARLTKERDEARSHVGMQSAIEKVLGLYGAVDRKPAPAWTTQTAHKGGAPGIPVLLLSDLHWGEVVDPQQIGGVNKFNLSIAQKRLKHTVSTAIDLCRILDAGMRYDGIVVPLAGDNCSGDIHEELQATNELPTIPTILDLATHLESAIRLLADSFGKVHLPCVTGNHGRNTRKVWAKDRTRTSFDWLLYKLLQRAFLADKRVTLDIADGPDQPFTVNNRRYLLTHGDRLGSGGDGMIGFLGPVTRGDHKRRTRQQQINAPYDTMICGHWHQYVHTQRLIVNGSLKGYDEYAYTEAFPFELPQQALWIVHQKHGETYRMPVRCE